MKVNNAQAEEIKGLLKESLFFLCGQFLGYKDWDVVHDDVERFLRKPARKKALMLPRGHLKTSFVTIGYTIQCLLKNPNTRVLIGNGVWDIARSFLSEIKAQLEQSQLKYLFGEFQSARWNADEIIIKQRTKPLKEPTVATTGVEAETTGGHYDIIILDDLIGLQNSQTPEQRSKVKRFRRSMINLLEPGGLLIEIGTRWHLDDTFSEIFEKEMKYYNVMVKKVYEPDKTGKQRLIFPKHFAKKFDDIKKDWTPTDDPYCMDYVEHLKSSMPLDEFSCTPGETPILMADWKTKPIEHVQVGDEIIGFTLGEGRKNGGLVKTRVKRTFSKQDHVLKLIMKSGREVLCTKDHRWWTGRSQFDTTHSSYAPAKIGTKLSFVCSVDAPLMSVDEKLDWAYLAGLFDGEGSTKSGGCLTLSQCESVNPKVHASMINVMDRLGIKYGSSIRDKYEKQQGRNNSPGNTSFWIKDSFNVGLNLIRHTSCAKASQIADRFLKKGKKFTREWDEVVDIKYDSLRTVYALETETSNYVAGGYASSNSQYLNQPFSSESQLFKPEMFKYWDTRPQGLFLAMTADLAISEARSADESAIVVCGMDKDWKFYILDYLKGQWRPSVLVERMFEMYERWKPHVVGMETNGFQRTLKLAVEDMMRVKKIYFPIEEIKTGPERSKEMRIKTLEPFYRNGTVFHASWMKGKDLEEQLQTFPKGKRDDICDSMSMSLPLLHPGIENTVSHEDDWDKWVRFGQENQNTQKGFFHYER